MTSRELTSGFDFWSRGHVRMAVMHLPVKFGANMRSYWHFAEIKDGGHRHLGFFGGSHGTTHPNPSQHVPIYLQHFPSYSNRKCKKLPIYPAFFFCLPWGRPCGNHAKRCMNEKTIQCLPNPSQHVPIYLQHFPSYSNRKCKKLPFSRTTAHIFVSPGDAPAIIMQYVAWMERQFNACQTPRGTLVVRTPCKNFVMIGSVVFKL